MPLQKKSVAVIGASGYTGAELIRFLLGHEKVIISALIAKSNVNKPLHSLFPQFIHTKLPDLCSFENVDWSGIDVVFCCSPHKVSQDVIKQLPTHLKVIDLSADFRLSDPKTYEKWYEVEHRALDLLKTSVYGLCELNREKIKKASLIANPGCYPTVAQLPLIPLLREKLISSKHIIIDAKSGVSGAGRSAKMGLIHSELSENFQAYSIGAHRHTPEIEQGLTQAAGEEVRISFTPHLVPMNRGMFATTYVELEEGNTIETLRECLHQSYAKEAFVHLLDAGQAPRTQAVRGSNHCHIGIFKDAVPNRIILLSAIDNLAKGAAGQALQNMNILFGYPETLGLEQGSVCP